MLARTLFAVLFLVAGAMHFVITPVYVSIMPPYLPAPALLVQISGVCEMLGGLGILIPATRPAAAWGLVLHAGHWPSIPAWVLWARLPLQLPLIYWAWLYTRR